MTKVASPVNEQFSAEAFSKQSGIFDQLYQPNTIIGYKRERVRSHVSNYLKAGSSILELNSGTGEDAVFLPGRATAFIPPIYLPGCSMS